MPFVGAYTRRVRFALSQPVAIGPEIFLMIVIAGVIGATVMISREFVAPQHTGIIIDLSLWSLPKYTMLSLARGVAAYLLSLVFTLVYGTVAAHNRRAEKVMLPALDVLQAIPVLGFLPGLVLALIALFPAHEIGLELACIIMIFTAQVWNMTFSFHASLRNVPQALREVAALQNLNGWQMFKLVEVPSAMIGLVWNSMMSMAGGWFFLTVNEAFTLGNRDYRLPGIGAYMNEAIQQDDKVAMVGAVVAMVIMIIVVDQVFWRPIVVWSQRFKVDDSTDADLPKSWALDILMQSKLFRTTVDKLHKNTPDLAARIVMQSKRHTEHPVIRKILLVTRFVLRWTALILFAAFLAWGLWSLVRLLVALPIYDSVKHEDWVTVILALLASFLRTTAAVVVGMLWALPVGILIGLSDKWSQRLQPVIQVVASFPAPMLFPIVIAILLTLHIPFTVGCTALMLLGAQWYILFNVIAGARSIPSDLKEVTRLNTMSRFERWTRLYIPCVYPHLVTGLVTAAGGAWNATIVSEYMQVQGKTLSAFGLGSLISHATAGGQYSLLCAGVVLMALFVVGINRIFWKRLYRLAENRYSLNT